MSIFSRRKKAKQLPMSPAEAIITPEITYEDDDAEIAAVIAAVAMMLEDEKQCVVSVAPRSPGKAAWRAAARIGAM
ncbi:MAG: hypothetical protein FWD16_03930 [Clostridia bacterium]|nr:hypothetical protein [Clostridia bacterium]